MNRYELIQRVNAVPAVIRLNTAEAKARDIIKKKYGIFWFLHKKELNNLKIDICVEIAIKEWDTGLDAQDMESEK